tara:strand:- start:42 stop:377 length:336 start_codon:yes stop_codon:yes gene_type:complete
MVELNTIYKLHCVTAENWSTLLKGSNGATYTVRWSRHDHHNQDSVKYDYSCTCPSYEFRKGTYCKHIKKIKDSGAHCNWSQFIDGGEVVEKDNQSACPECGSDVRSMGWGV